MLILKTTKVFFTLFLIAAFNLLHAQSPAAGDYRSNVNPSGAWSTASNWQVYNGTSWITATTAPNSSNGVITIVDGDSIAITAATTLDQVIISSSGRLSIFHNTTAFTATLNDGIGTDLEVNGRLYISSNGTLSGNGTTVINPAGTFFLRNQGVLSAKTTNNGTVNVNSTGNIRNTTFVNNKTFILIDLTLNLNNSTFTNNDSLVITGNSLTYFATNPATDTAAFINSATGLVYRTNSAGTTTFNTAVKVYNYGKFKGSGEFTVYTPNVNSGTIDPGNGGSGILTVNPGFVNGKNPVIIIEVTGNGVTPGTDHDQLKFSSVILSNTNVSGCTLYFFDNGNANAGTSYNILVSTILSALTGPFASNYAPDNYDAPFFLLNVGSVKKVTASRSWDGGAGTLNWGDAANWNPDGVPAATESVVVNSPVNISVNSAAVCKALNLNTLGSSLTILSSRSLTVNGTLTLTQGNININGQSLTLNGTIAPVGSGFLIGSSGSSLTIGGTSGGDFGTLKFGPDNSRLSSLTINRSGSNGTVSIGSTPLLMRDVVTLSNGTLNTNGNLVLLSDATGTARIAAITNGNLIGEVVSQLFIPGGADRRRWRFLASPVEGATFLNSWQDSIHITGSGSGGQLCPNMTKHTNGFDANASTAISVVTYSELTNSWSSIPNTNATQLKTGTGYRVFVRGSRKDGCVLLTTMPTTTSNVTLVAKGTIAKGTQKIPLTITNGNGWNLVGNPYASPIDLSSPVWQAAMGVKIGRTINVLNPVTNCYASWHPLAGSVNGGSGIIASGQSFFVYVNANDTLRIEESYKSTTHKTGLFGKTGSMSSLKIQLADTAVLDETVAYTYAGAGKFYDQLFDGKKADFGTNRIATFTTQDSTRLVFNAFNSDTTSLNDTLPLACGLTGTGNTYKLRFNGINSFKGSITLYDRYTGDIVLLSNDTAYQFATHNDASSKNIHRFYLIFNATGSSLPVQMLSFSAHKTKQNVLVNWKTSSEKNNAYFIVERSNDNKNFAQIGRTNSQSVNSSVVLSYQFADEQPMLNTLNYYRLKQVDVNGDFSYSNTVSVSYNETASLVKDIYPNPCNNGQAPVLKLDHACEYIEAEVLNIEGKTVSKKKKKGGDEITLDEFSNLPAGVYVVIINTEGLISRHKIVKQ